jgi:CBS domain-containing protein
LGCVIEGESNMRCSEIMKTAIECVSPRTSVRKAAERMRDQVIGFLPVCDENMRPSGTITDRDIAVRIVAEGAPIDTPVENCMTKGVVDCRPTDSIEDARELMEQHQVSRIICTSRQGRIEGVISLSDIVDLDELSGAQTLRRVSEREIRGDSGLSPGL